MSLKTFVKISQIDNLSDARYCAGMMADILGFNLEEGTEGYVSPQKFNEITDWVAGVKFCGEFTRASAAEIKLAAGRYGIDYLEVQDIDVLEELESTDKDLILKITISNSSDLEQLGPKLSFAAEFVKYITIYSTDPSLSDDIAIALTQVEIETPLLRGYDLSEANVNAVVDDGIFHGIELEGSPEDRPGYKDYGAVMDILEVLEAD